MRYTRRMRAGQNERAISAGLVALLHAAILWLVLHARHSPELPVSTRTLATFTIAPHATPAPPPAYKIRPARITGQTGRSGANARRSAVAVPIPIVATPLPLPAPLTPQSGTAVIGGAASVGAGSGAGERGDGAGSGGSGDGNGAGGGTRARLVAGTIGPRDYPKVERSARIGGVVTIAFTVGTDGRVGACAVTLSSGNAALDSATCRLVEARFRYTPARDAAGTPISERRGWRQRWWIEGD